MPAGVVPSEETTTAPMRFSDIVAAASATLVPGLIVKTSPLGLDLSIW